jgi:triacylglycerol esterase/lipase EstA (alpha/beta hydrolase family)
LYWRYSLSDLALRLSDRAIPILYGEGIARLLDGLKRAVALANLPQPQPMVVIGHSMGGLLAKSLVCDSSNDLWNAVFTVSPERLAVGKAALSDLQGSFFFRARKDVAKVIFMATPQRGSDLAANWIVRLGSRLVHLSGDWSTENRVIAREEKPFIREGCMDILPEADRVASKVCRQNIHCL